MAFFLLFIFITASTTASSVNIRPLSSPMLGQKRWESDMSLDEGTSSTDTSLLTNRRTPPKVAKQPFPNAIRPYNDKRCPAFPDRVFIGTKLDMPNIDVLAYDSISTGEIVKSDHDLVYQIIQFPINGTFTLDIDVDVDQESINQQMFTALIITWNFGESNGRNIAWVDILSSILAQTESKYAMDAEDFNTVFFSFQEGHYLVAHHKELISKMKIMFPNLIHKETTQMVRSPYFVISGMLFMHKTLKAVPLSKSLVSNQLFFDDYTLGFHFKGAVFTKPMIIGIDEHGNDIVILFIALHCRVDNSRDDYGLEMRMRDFNSMKELILSRFTDGKILCIGAGDVNFRQMVSDLINQQYAYVKPYDQFYHFVEKDDFWRELQAPTGFRATYKHKVLKKTVNHKAYWIFAIVFVLLLYLLRAIGFWL